MKETLKNLKERIKDNGWHIIDLLGNISRRIVFICMGIFALVVVVAVAGMYFKDSSKGSLSDAKVTLGEYKNISIKLEEAEVTDKTVKEAAEWSVTYYNQSLDKKEEKLSLNTLTDEQVKKAFQVDSVDAFYDTIRKNQEESNKKKTRTDAYDQICEYLLKTCTIENLPKDEVKTRLEKSINDTKEACAKYYNMSFAEYCKSTGMTEEEYKKSLEEHTEKSLKQELILTAIGDKEDIRYEEKEFDSYIDGLIQDGGYESKETIYEQYGEEYLKTAYRVEFITDWLIDQADITYASTKENKQKTSPQPKEQSK